MSLFRSGRRNGTTRPSPCTVKAYVRNRSWRRYLRIAKISCWFTQKTWLKIHPGITKIRILITNLFKIICVDGILHFKRRNQNKKFWRYQQWQSKPPWRPSIFSRTRIYKDDQYTRLITKTVLLLVNKNLYSLHLSLSVSKKSSSSLLCNLWVESV